MSLTIVVIILGVLVFDRINAATSCFWKISQPIDFRASKQYESTAFTVPIGKPVWKSCIFASQIKLVVSPTLPTFYTPSLASVESIGRGLFTVRNGKQLVFSVSNGSNPLINWTSGRLVTPKTIPPPLLICLYVIEAMSLACLLALIPDPTVAPIILCLRVAYVMKTALRWIAQHPVVVLSIPSVYLLLFYPPMWKDIDALCQLVLPASVTSIFHFPATYCFLARIPIWLGDCVFQPRALDLMGAQNPSMTGIYALIMLQHAALITILGFFCNSVTQIPLLRGAIVLLFAGTTALYANVHSCGSEAWGLIALTAVFTLGLRIYRSSEVSILDWVGYFVALVIVIGSRHIDILVGFWLVALLLVRNLVSDSSQNRPLESFNRWRVIGFAGLAFVGAIATDFGVALVFAKLAGVQPRTTLGRTLSDRIDSFLKQMPEASRLELAIRLANIEKNDEVKAAILDQAKIGSFYQGTGSAIAARLGAEGLSGEALGAQTDHVILLAALTYLKSFQPTLLKVVSADFWKGLWQTNSTLARVPFLHNKTIGRYRLDHPDQWRPLDVLSSTYIGVADAWQDRAGADGFLCPRLSPPLLFLYILGTAACVVCYFRHRALITHALPALSVMAMGLVIFGATMICVYFMSRYALPMLISGLWGLSHVMAGLFAKTISAPDEIV